MVHLRNLLTAVALAGGGFAVVAGVALADSDATIEATDFSVSRLASGEESAVCPGRKRALGGGVVQSGDADRLGVRASGPLDRSGVTADTVDGDKAKQWYAAVVNLGDETRDFKVFAICESPVRR